MREMSTLLKRLQKIMPPGVTPKFTCPEDLMAWHREEGLKRSAEVEKINHLARIEKKLGRSGIQELHRQCTFDNYRVTCDGQRHALTVAKSYAQNFGSGFTSFVFSGSPGTGKNHLASAIGNFLLKQGRSVLVITVPDLMLSVRRCYDQGESEFALIDELCRVDLLVLDEVGIQRESKGERLILNQIIDRRVSAIKPVSILTNLNHEELERVLGARIIDRLTIDGGIWVNFSWDSYRKNVTHLR